MICSALLPILIIALCLWNQAIYMTVKRRKYSGNERPTSRDGQNLFAEARFRYIEVLFHLFYYYWGKENCFFYRVLRYIETRYIQVVYGSKWRLERWAGVSIWLRDYLFWRRKKNMVFQDFWRVFIFWTHIYFTHI